MAAQNQQAAAEQLLEARRVSVIFGVLTLLTVWPASALIALILAVTTGNGPQGIALGLIPATLLSIRHLLRRYPLVLRSVPFLLIGWSPWLIYSVRNDWSTLRFPGVDVHVPYPERVLLFVHQLPIVFGVRLPISNEWLAPPADSSSGSCSTKPRSVCTGPPK